MTPDAGGASIVIFPSGRRRALAGLRQATWEATQFVSPDELRELVERVLREIETDEP